MAIRKSKKFTRDPKAPKVLPKDIQDWDLSVFRHLHEHRLLTSSQLILLTGRSVRTAQDRLKRLWNGHFLDRIDGDKAGTGNLNNPAIYALTVQGADELKNIGELARAKLEAVRKSGEVHVKHTLLVADFNIKVRTACEDSNGRVRYVPKDELLAGNARQLLPMDKQLRISAKIDTPYGREEKATIPDGLFALDFVDEGRRKVFFLEADCKTMPKRRTDMARKRNLGKDQTDVYRKYAVYDAYRCIKDQCKKEFGFPFYYVLFLTTANQQRVTNLVEELRSVYRHRDGTHPGYRRWSFGFTDHILDPVNDILRVPWTLGDGQPGTLYYQDLRQISGKQKVVTGNIG